MLGIGLCALILLLPQADGLTQAGQASLAILALCVVWWMFTPVALPVTSLVGMALIPAFGVMPVGDAMALFGNQAVFFVIGVFLVASVMMQTGLSTRLALVGLKRFARNEDAVCLVVLWLSWGLCAVVVSHAVAALMLPIVLGIIRALDLGPSSRTARRLLLSMAWGTVCGSNLGLLSSARASLGLEFYDSFRVDSALSPDAIGFLQYSAGSAPISLCAVICAAVVLRWWCPPQGLELGPAIEQLEQDAGGLGPMSSNEWTTLWVVAAMVVMMVVAGPVYMSVVALLFSGVLFGLRVLSWEDAARYVNWGIILLYGGAIAVGAAVSQTGAAGWLVEAVLPAEGLGVWGAFVLIGGVCAGLTELMSNSAVMAVVLPVALPVAESVGLNAKCVAILGPVCAGLAYVLPTSTPAMAMVFGTGYIRIRDTIPGIIITLFTLSIFLVVAAIWWPLLGLEVNP